MKPKFLAVCVVAVVLAGGVCGAAPDATPTNGNPSAGQEPLMLDISRFYWERFITPQRTNMEFVGFAGPQVFDGLPFNVEGRACLYTEMLEVSRGGSRSSWPDFIGVKVGRAFDELHLLHASRFTDREGETLAKVRLNYADGTRHEVSIAYGCQVRDWERMGSEEKEVYTDPETKVIWRGPGQVRLKSTTRLSKTRLLNPFPEKPVLTIDFVTAEKVASYDVVAATVANRDPNRPVSPAIPLDRPERVFDGSIPVRVIDEADRPVEGVTVIPNLLVDNSPCATITTPFHTGADAMGTVRYPKYVTRCIYLGAFKAGWTNLTSEKWHYLNRPRVTTNGIEMIVRMGRITPIAVEAVAGAAEPVKGTNATGLAAAAASPGSARALPVAARASASAHSGSAGDTPSLLTLIIDCPAGTDVRIEYKDHLRQPEWQLLTVLTNVPTSPYLYECGGEPGAGAQRFYRAVCSP